MFQGRQCFCKSVTPTVSDKTRLFYFAFTFPVTIYQIFRSAELRASLTFCYSYSILAFSVIQCEEFSIVSITMSLDVPLPPSLIYTVIKTLRSSMTLNAIHRVKCTESYRKKNKYMIHTSLLAME